MTTVKIGEKEFNVTFGYEATLKSKLLTRLAKAYASTEDGLLGNVEELLLFMPDFLLVGLQKEHKNEYGYDLDTRKGYDEKRNKLFNLIADAVDNEEVDCLELFNQLEKELTRNGFLKKMFEKELEKIENTNENK